MNIQEAYGIAIQGYKDAALQALQISFPYIPFGELERAVDYSINTRFKDHNAIIKNNYTHKDTEVTLSELAEFIMSKKPIITPSGVMFTQHGTVPNPLVRMVERFLESREELKTEMFKYPKGTAEFEFYNLGQLLAKLDANATYGVLGARTAIYFNVYVSSSITHQGMSAVSAAALLFESFLSNNVGFSSLNDLVTFIANVKNEDRHWDSRIVVGTRYISRGECFRKLIITCKFGYIPTEKDMSIVWDMLHNISDDDIVRLYYKNNLYEFVENPFVMDKIITIMKKLHTPYINPNKVPKEIKAELEEFWDILKEYVYYDKQLIDRLGKMDNIIRNVSIIMDTDSSIISLDAWYRCILSHTYDIDMDIKHHIYDPFVINKLDEFGDREDLIDPIIDVTPPLTYDFYTDSMIEQMISVNPDQIIPQDGLRYTIINIMAYCLTQMINDFMRKYVINSNATHPTKGCLFIMKNEFLFKSVLDTDGKKNYAAIVELQEGHSVPKKSQLKITGMPIDKVGLLPKVKEQLQKILREKILDCENIDQVDILRALATMEKEMFLEMQNGSKEFYKPASIKAMSSYPDPMRIQGIKGAVAYNSISNKSVEHIDLSTRNSVIIIKCSITPKNIYQIEQSFPNEFNKIIELMKTKEYCTEITSIAIPSDANVPEWLIPFINYTEIINDNIRNFPLGNIGMSETPNKAVNYSNIISI